MSMPLCPPGIYSHQDCLVEAAFEALRELGQLPGEHQAWFMAAAIHLAQRVRRPEIREAIDAERMERAQAGN